MSENAYIIMVLFFVLFVLILMSLDFQDDIRKWLKRRAEKKEQSNVSEEAERTEERPKVDIWEEMQRTNREELRQREEAIARDVRTWEELQRVRLLRESREEMMRNFHEQTQEQREQRRARSNTTRTNTSYHNATTGNMYNMGTWNMADSPNTHRASAYNQGDVVRLHFPEGQRDHMGQLLHGQVVRLDSPREDYAGEWYCSFVNPTTMPEAFRVRRLCVREYFFVPAEPEPDTFVVGDVVRLEFPEHERFIHGDYSWQHPRQTTEGMLHGQYVILRRQHPGAPYLWDVAILNEADCPPSMIGRQLVVRQKYFLKKQPAPAIVYPKKVKLTEGGLPKL